MKVAELMEKLKNMDGDAEVRFQDTYWENEGYGKNAENPEYLTRLVRVVRTEDMNGKTAVVLRFNVALAEGWPPPKNFQKVLKKRLTSLSVRYIIITVPQRNANERG